MAIIRMDWTVVQLDTMSLYCKCMRRSTFIPSAHGSLGISETTTIIVINKDKLYSGTGLMNPPPATTTMLYGHSSFQYVGGKQRARWAVLCRIEEEKNTLTGDSLLLHQRTKTGWEMLRVIRSVVVTGGGRVSRSAVHRHSWSCRKVKLFKKRDFSFWFLHSLCHRYSAASSADGILPVTC